jgi:hypothetical protein
MNNNESSKYTNSMLQDIMKKHAPVNESNERKVDENAPGWPGTLSYLTQILSRAKEARQAQLILGEALSEKFSDPSVISNQRLVDVTSSTDRVGIFLLLVGADAASKIIEMSEERDAVLLIKSCLDLDEMPQERVFNILKDFVAMDEAAKFKNMQPKTYDEHVAVLRLAAHDDLEGFHKAALSLLSAR